MKYTMIISLVVIIGVVALFIFLGGNNGNNTSTQKSTFTNVSPSEANEMIRNDNIQVIDVRTLEEYNSGHIPNAKLLPLQELPIRLKELDPNEKYIIICKSGNRSTQASQLLIKNGFKNIYNINGGMNHWEYEVTTN